MHISFDLYGSHNATTTVQVRVLAESAHGAHTRRCQLALYMLSLSYSEEQAQKRYLNSGNIIITQWVPLIGVIGRRNLGIEVRVMRVSSLNGVPVLEINVYGTMFDERYG